MSDYIPTTEQVRGFWASDGKHQPAAKSYDEQEAGDEFDRWLAAHDAEIRAEAWDEGALWAAVETGAIPDENTEWLAPEDNPYRTPRPHYELFPGTQEALDALSIRKGKS